jgi:hypothetical protein
MHNIRIQIMMGLTKNRKVFNKLFDFRTKYFPTSRTRKNVRSSQIHEAYLAEGVAAVQDPRNLVFVVVCIVADGAINIHSVI